MKNKQTPHQEGHGVNPASPFYSVPLEEGIAGILVGFGGYADDICGMLSEDMFTDPDTALVFSAAKTLVSKGIKPDLITIGQQIREIAKGRNMDLELIDYTMKIVGGSNWELYCRQLMSYYFKRKVYYGLSEIQAHLQDHDFDFISALDEINALSARIDERSVQGIVTRTFPDILDEVEELLHRRIECREKGEMPGINTGLGKLNEYTMGWQPSDLIILAARPSMGKTALSLFFGKTAAERGVPVVFFTLEMSDLRLTQRLILSECDVPVDAVKSGNMTEIQVKKFSATKEAMKRLPISIIEKGTVGMEEIRRTAKALHKQGKCGMIILDYLQLLDSGRKGQTNREQEVASYSRALKSLAKELKVPVIALSQLSRQVEGRQDKHPTLADLRESGAIEQDADVVLMLYRDEYYNPQSDKIGIGEIGIEKNREGDTRIAEFGYNPEMTKIFNPKHIPVGEIAMRLPADCPF